MRASRILALFAAVLWLGAWAPLPAAAAAASSRAARDVGPGDPLRRRLLDALRPRVERDLGQKLIFIVHRLRLQDDWAFADVSPRTQPAVRSISPEPGMPSG